MQPNISNLCSPNWTIEGGRTVCTVRVCNIVVVVVILFYSYNFSGIDYGDAIGENLNRTINEAVGDIHIFLFLWYLDPVSERDLLSG